VATFTHWVVLHDTAAGQRRIDEGIGAGELAQLGIERGENAVAAMYRSRLCAATAAARDRLALLAVMKDHILAYGEIRAAPMHRSQPGTGRRRLATVRPPIEPPIGLLASNAPAECTIGPTATQGTPATKAT